MEIQKKFICAINCMDGRVQDAVKNYMQRNYRVDYVDMVTEPGPNKILADNLDKAFGHFGCAGNPTEKEEQIEHLKKAKETVESFGFPIEIILLWVDGDWQTVEKI